MRELDGKTRMSRLELIGEPGAGADVDQIIDLIAAEAHRWNEGQPMRLADFTPDSDYVTYDGTELHGLEENRRLHDDLRRGVLRGSRLTCQVHRVRFITGDVAVVHSSGNLQLRFHRRPKPGRASIQTMVVRRTGQGWQIEAFQNTRIRRPGPVGRLVVRMMNRL